MESVCIPESVTDIGTGAFCACRDLKGAFIPGSVKKIGFMAFCGCEKLKGVTIADGVEMIDGLAFEDCAELESVYIPESVTYIGSNTVIDSRIVHDGSFNGCPKVLLRGRKGSYAEGWAWENMVRFSAE